MTFTVIRDLPHPLGRPSKRKSLDPLITLAKKMEIGDAAELTLSEAQTFRIVLNALGYECVTDGYRCQTRGKTLAFKLEKIC